MSKTTKTEDLGSRLKGYEAQTELRLPVEDYLVVRIDGHKFSKFTKGFKKPFDDILSETMVKTTEALVKEFGAVTGYTQSDEISLVFAPSYSHKVSEISLKDFLQILREDFDEDKNISNEILEITHKKTGEKYVAEYLETNVDRDEYSFEINIASETLDKCLGFNGGTLCGETINEYGNINEIETIFDLKIKEVNNLQIFGSRVQKMTSLISAFTTMKFNNIMRDLIETRKKEMDSSYGRTEEEKNFNIYYHKIIEKIGNAWFDARIYNVPTKEEAYNSIMWRIRDSQKNSRQMFAQTYCSHKSLLNKSGQEQVQFCLEQTGKDWNKIQDGYKYGFLVKREKYLKPVTFVESEGTMNYTQNEFVERTRITRFPAIGFTSFSEENVDVIISKNLGDKY